MRILGIAAYRQGSIDKRKYLEIPVRAPTFRSGDQSDVLMSDNQARYYNGSAPEERRRFAASAWGEKGASAEALGGRPMAWPAGRIDA
jgi:hypothetical protein